MRIFSLRSWRSRRPQAPANVNRVSTLSNAATLYEPSPLPAALLSSFPNPPSAVSPLPIQSNNPFFSQIQAAAPAQPAAYPQTFLPNISQSSLDTLADPLARLPNAPNRLSTFEAFLASARQAEIQRIDRERRMVIAWQRAEEERKKRDAIRSRHDDPWRGGFGPSGGGGWRMDYAPRNDVGLGIGMAVPMSVGNFGSVAPRTLDRERLERRRREEQRPRTSGNGVKAAKVWLRKVTSMESLRRV